MPRYVNYVLSAIILKSGTCFARERHDWVLVITVSYWDGRVTCYIYVYVYMCICVYVYMCI